MARTNQWLTAAILIILFGVFMAWANLLLMTIIQLIAPAKNLGSIFGFLTTSSLFLQVGSLFLTGKFAGILGSSLIFEIGGTLLSVTALFVAATPVMRQITSMTNLSNGQEAGSAQ